MACGRYGSWRSILPSPRRGGDGKLCRFGSPDELPTHCGEATGIDRRRGIGRADAGRGPVPDAPVLPEGDLSMRSLRWLMSVAAVASGLSAARADTPKG